MNLVDHLPKKANGWEVMRMFVKSSVARLRGVLVAIGMLGLLLVAAGCGGSSSKVSGGTNAHASFYTGGTPGGNPVHGGILRIDRAEPPENLDPIRVGPPSIADLDLQIFDQLAEALPNSNEPQPGAARSWTVSPNGLTVTFHIRPGVEFSNGEPLTGEDVVYSLERQSQPDSESGVFLPTLWSKVSLVNPMTVPVDLKKPTPSFIDDLTIVNASIVPKHLIEREGPKQFNLHPVGSGPFMITNTTTGNATVTMARNPHYWRAGLPYLDGVVWNTIPEANARMLAVRTGAAEIATGMSFSQAATLRKAPGVRLLIEPLRGSEQGWFNLTKPPFNEASVRKALALATPSASVIKTIFAGLAVPTNAVFGTELKYWDPSDPYFSFDIAKAKQELGRSTVPHGFSTTLLVPAGEPDQALIAAILQSAWAKIGVQVKILSLDPATYVTREVAGEFDLALVAPQESVIETYWPDNVLIELASVPPHTYAWVEDNPKVNALIAKATVSQNEAEKQRLEGKLQKLMFYEESDYLSLAEAPSLTLVSESLRGFADPPSEYYRLEQAWLQK
jgi:peptide/nickel transport system substrate-binding protein